MVSNRRIHATLPGVADSLAQVLDSVSCDVARLDSYRPSPVRSINPTDLDRLFNYQIDYLGRSAIFAMSHVRAMGTVIHGASSVYSPFVLCRAALESLGHLYWACDEQLGANGRLLGILRERMKEQPRALAILQEHGSDEKKHEAEAVMKNDRRASVALRAGMSKAEYKRTNRLSPTDAVSKLMAGHETKHSTAYGLLSEHSHGNTTWVGTRESADLESLKRMRPAQATVETFLMPALWSLEGLSRAFGRAQNVMPLEFDSGLLTSRVAHLIQIAHSCGHDDVWQRL